MIKRNLYDELIKIVDKSNIKINEEMKNHTSLRVGGKAKYLIEPTSEKEIESLVKLMIELKEPYYIIGRGSNLLVKDEGIDGVVIKITDKFSGIDESSNKLTVKSGTSLASVAKYAYINSLSGIEFASGIPGSIGGAIAMNAGAYGGEMKDIVESVKIIDDLGNIRVLSNEEMKFSYRRSLLTSKSSYIVLEVVLKLTDGDKEVIYNEMKTRADKRTLSQPLDMCNCGSTFKRPEGHFAGQLIEECGLKGYAVNGVEVSSKHAGFVVNNGKTTATDMINMINFVKEKVKEKFGVVLEEEVKII